MGIGSESESGERDSPLFAQTVRLVRIAGWLMITAALSSIPGTLALEPMPALSDYMVISITVLTGIVYLLAPARWLTPLWIHVSIVGGAFAIAATVAIFGPDYGFFFALLAIYAAYAVGSRATFAAYLVLLILALFAPIAYEGEVGEDEGERPDLVALPVMLISAVAVRELRETLERRQRRYRAFADEAIALATRIRGSARGEAGDAEAIEERLDELSARTSGESPEGGSAPG